MLPECLYHISLPMTAMGFSEGQPNSSTVCRQRHVSRTSCFTQDWLCLSSVSAAAQSGCCLGYPALQSGSKAFRRFRGCAHLECFLASSSCKVGRRVATGSERFRWVRFTDRIRGSGELRAANWTYEGGFAWTRRVSPKVLSPGPNSRPEFATRVSSRPRPAR
jgi:hypothetical protein